MSASFPMPVPEPTTEAVPGRSWARARRTKVVALAAVMALGGAALADAALHATDEEPALPRVARQITAGEGLRIVALGSSSTEGVGASRPDKAYPARLQAVLSAALPDLAGGVTVINRGIGGEAVDEMVRRLDKDVIAAKPDLVIWQTGSNDPLRNVPLDHFREATKAALARLREAGIDVVLMEPQWCPRLDATPGAYLFRDAVREIGAEMDVPVIRRSQMMREWVGEALVTPKELFAPDGLHMADKGYALLAKETASEILQESQALDGPSGETAATAVEE